MFTHFQPELWITIKLSSFMSKMCTVTICTAVILEILEERRAPHALRVFINTWLYLARVGLEHDAPKRWLHHH